MGKKVSGRMDGLVNNEGGRGRLPGCVASRMRDVARCAAPFSSTYLLTYLSTHLLTYSLTLGSVSDYDSKTADLKQAFATVAGDHHTHYLQLQPPPSEDTPVRGISAHLTCHAHLPLIVCAGVDSSAVEVAITAASVIITATIAVPAATTAAAMTTSLKAELANPELATAALGVSVASLAS